MVTIELTTESVEITDMDTIQKYSLMKYRNPKNKLNGLRFKDILR